jgi:hypothetical protein
MPSSRPIWLVEAALLMKEPDAAVGFVVDHLGSSFQMARRMSATERTSPARRCGCRQGGRHVGHGFEAQNLIERSAVGDESGGEEFRTRPTQPGGGQREEFADGGVGVVARALGVGHDAEKQIEGGTSGERP